MVELAIVDDAALEVATYPARLDVLGEAELVEVEVVEETAEAA